MPLATNIGLQCCNCVSGGSHNRIEGVVPGQQVVPSPLLRRHGCLQPVSDLRNEIHWIFVFTPLPCVDMCTVPLVADLVFNGS